MSPLFALAGVGLMTGTCGAAPAVMQRKENAVIVNFARVIALVYYHFVIAVWRAKGASSRNEMNNAHSDQLL